MGDEVECVGPFRQVVRRARVEGGRQHRHVVRVTPEEEAKLLALALRYRVSVPKLLVDSALSGGSQAAAETSAARGEILAELFAVHRLLANVANNVNQVAKVANSTGEIVPQAPEVLAAVRRVADRIDDVIDGFGR